MSSFISAGNTSSETAATAIENNGFWPKIEPSDFRETNRLDSTITNARLESALLAAMATVNRVLRHWQAAKVDAGYQTMASLPIPVWQAPEVFNVLYLRAVYSTAHASLLERYADYDATNSGRERGESLQDPADGYRRDAAWAISEIEGRPHSTVELI
ncbi:head completion/stabilization protein [Halomonas sp. MC140]|nr:head completion/stabilization protein [Halomonas sp. MC140]MDN7131784.1 head completion/stabilization protein [Halomonas sp. MC140]